MAKTPKKKGGKAARGKPDAFKPYVAKGGDAKAKPYGKK